MEVQGYPNYIIYEDGKIRSKHRRGASGRFLKQTIGKQSPYCRVSFSKNGKVDTFLVHRLVAIHYIPNDDNKPQVNHIDGNKLNNHVSNLEWVTNIENGNKHQNNRTEIRCIHKCGCGYYFDKMYYGKRHRKWFKTKKDAICYKYIWILRMKAGHYQ